MADTGFTNPSLNGSGFTNPSAFLGKVNGGASFSPWGIVGGAADAVGGFLPLKTEYSGDKGLVTQTMDTVYDAASNAVGAIPVYGLAVSAIMKANKLLGKGINALGGGTDGMTTKDAILGSAFLQTTPIGIINGAFGSKTNSMKKDAITQSIVGDSYDSTYKDIDDAVAHSNKKYGLFSQREKEEQNNAIAAAGRRLNILKGIADNELINLLLLANQLDMASASYTQQLNGGYNQLSVRAARKGMKLFTKEQRDRTLTILAKHKTGGNIEFTPFVFDYSAFDLKIELFKKGGTLKEKTNTFEKFKLYLHEHGNRDDETDYDLKSFYESKDIFEDGKTPYELWLDTEEKEPGYGHMLGRYKKPHHITYEGKNGEFWKKDSNGEWTYSVPEGHKDINGREYTLEDYIKYFSDPEGQRSHFIFKGLKYDGSKLLPNITVTPTGNNVQEFKQGGSIIPEGALHARKHHLEEIKPELDGQITSKGIPVIIEKEGGEVEQQAEIEHSEIILQKSITETIEKAYKLYYSDGITEKELNDLAIEIGKLLTNEILYNTDDRVNLIENVE